MNVIDCLPLRPGIEKYDPINNGDPAYTHPTAPGILFRTINLENYDKDSFSEASSSKEPLAFVERARELHAELPFFGIEVVPYTPVITNIPKILLLAVHEIQGSEKREENYYKAPKKEQRATDKLYDALWDYVEHKIESGEPYLEDIIGLHQYLYTTSDDFILVDIEPHVIPERIASLASFNSEVTCIEHLLHDARSMYRYDHKRVVSYTTYAAQLIATSAAMNGIDAPRSAIHLALNAQTDPDDISGHLKEQLKDLPKNRAEFYALEEKRQLAINKIKDQQASS